MFDLRAIRENPDAFDAGWKKKGLEPQTPAILALDEKLRAAKTAKQDAEQVRNTNSKLIGKAKASGDEAEAQRLMTAVAEAKTAIETAGETEAETQAALDAILMGLPNLPLDVVPDGEDESCNLQACEAWGTVRAFNYAPKDHADLGEALVNAKGQSLMDFDSAVKMSGARFVALRGDLARLERALAAFMLDVQTGEHGYEEVSPPLLVRNHALEGTGQLPKFGEDLFSTAGDPEPFRTAARKFSNLSENTDLLVDVYLKLTKRLELDGELKAQVSRVDTLAEQILELSIRDHEQFLELHNVVDGQEQSSHCLIPTAEVPLTNLVREQILAEDQLPLRMTAHTPCFRSEAGSAGRDTKGMIRLHQFNKVELVSIVRGEEEGLEELERMTGCAEAILQKLDLPYRKMLLCAGDMGAGARKTYDLEVWLPSQDTYREISSCSYCGDFQARRMDARFRPAATEETPKPKPEFVHTLNGSGLAVGRTLVAVLENYQNEDGSITVPAILRGYMGGQSEIRSPR